MSGALKQNMTLTFEEKLIKGLQRCQDYRNEVCKGLTISSVWGILVYAVHILTIGARLLKITDAFATWSLQGSKGTSRTQHSFRGLKIFEKRHINTVSEAFG